MPALAAVTPIECGIEAIAPADRAPIDAMVSRILHSDDYQPSADDETVSGKIFVAINGCADRLHWSEDQKGAALRFTLLRMTYERAASELRVLGVATAPLEQIVAANPAIFVPGPSPIDRVASHDKLVADARAAGIPMDKAAVEMLVLAYFGSVTLANQAAADFAKG